MQILRLVRAEAGLAQDDRSGDVDWTGTGGIKSSKRRSFDSSIAALRTRSG